ncbi:MAG: 6-pyruvoyl tetrahydropterin synthase family protein [bacterium]
MKLGTTHYIDCAHYLPGHAKCGQMHGHTYKIEIIIEGENKDGMVLDFSNMKTAVNDLLAKYDHKSLNDFLEYPSVENICEMLQKELSKQLPFPFTLRIWEGEGKWAEL